MDNFKQEIVDTGKYLLENGLVARTWGNLSARLDNEYFYITPSGKDYLETTIDDIAKVKIEDCSYDEKGPKPSSEKKIHAVIYALRNDAKYIIHTHQLYASAICAEGFSVKLSDGKFIPCAAYGLPGTNTLKKNVEKVVQEFQDADIILLEKHGTFIMASTMQEAIDKANYLESECKKLFDQRVAELIIPKDMKPYLDDYAQMVPTMKEVDDLEALQMVKEKNAAAMLYARDGKPLGVLDAKIQNFVYRKKYSKLRKK